MMNLGEKMTEEECNALVDVSCLLCSLICNNRVRPIYRLADISADIFGRYRYIGIGKLDIGIGHIGIGIGIG